MTARARWVTENVHLRVVGVGQPASPPATSPSRKRHWSRSTAATTRAPTARHTTRPAGSGSLAGTVTFTLHDNGDCTGTVVYGPVDRAVAGPVAGVTVETSNTTAMTASGTFSWKVAYDSTNSAQEDIPGSCHETSALTVGNRGTVSGP